MSLKAKIQAANSAAHFMNHFGPIAKKAIAEFQGKAYLATGSKSKKFADYLPKFEAAGLHQAFFYLCYKSLYLKIKTTAQTSETSCLYHEEDLYLAAVNDDGSLSVSENEFSPLKENHQEAEILAAKEQIKSLQAQISSIESGAALFKFERCY